MKIFKDIRRTISSYSFVTQLLILIVALAFFAYGAFKVVNFDVVRNSEYIKIIIPAVITVSSACLTIVKTQADKSRLVALQYITEKRIDWLKDTRMLTVDLYKNVTIFLYMTPIYDFYKDYKLRDAYGNIMASIAGLYVRYNFSGERDTILLHTLDALQKHIEECKKALMNFDEITFNSEKTQIRELLELFMNHSQVYVKLEWDRVKEETIYDGSIKLRGKIIKKKMVKERGRLYKKIQKYKLYNGEVLEDYNINEVINKFIGKCIRD